MSIEQNATVKAVKTKKQPSGNNPATQPRPTRPACPAADKECHNFGKKGTFFQGLLIIPDSPC